LKINRYCKFLIYLWTDIIFGFAGLVCGLFLLSLVFAALLGNTSFYDKPLQGVGLAFSGLISGGISFFIILIAAGIWIGPTLLLLLFGVISAPKEEEDQSGLGKKALLTSIAVVITLAGFTLFLMYASYNETKLFSFGILVVMFIIDGIIFAIAFRDSEESEEEEYPTKEPSKRIINDSAIYCDQCGKKASKDAVYCKYCGNKL